MHSVMGRVMPRITVQSLRRTIATLPQRGDDGEVHKQMLWTSGMRVRRVKEERAKVARATEWAWLLAIDKAMQEAIMRGEWTIKTDAFNLAKHGHMLDAKLMNTESLQRVLGANMDQLSKKSIYVAYNVDRIYIGFGPDAETELEALQRKDSRTLNWVFGTLVAFTIGTTANVVFG